MKLNFIKMQAQGNDYIYFDFLESKIPEIDFSVLSLKLSDRHFGIGSDGIVLILPDDKYDAMMRIFNADGSEAEMCGSALRCTASYLNSCNKLKSSVINTLSGKKNVEILNDGKIKVCLGKAKMPKKKPISIFGFSGYPVDIGNPHFVCFTDVINPESTKRYGSLIENNHNLPARTNVEFVRIDDIRNISLEIWERGSGKTLACGTGAGAAVFAGITQNKLDNKVKVKMPGGIVLVEFIDNEIYLSGEVEVVFSGNIEL